MPEIDIVTLPALLVLEAGTKRSLMEAFRNRGSGRGEGMVTTGVVEGMGPRIKRQRSCTGQT